MIEAGYRRGQADRRAKALGVVLTASKGHDRSQLAGAIEEIVLRIPVENAIEHGSAAASQGRAPMMICSLVGGSSGSSSICFPLSRYP